MRQLDEVKAQLEQLAKWQASVSDGEATVELYGLEPDEDLLAESNQALQSLKADLDRWELERLLSGPYDKEGAVISINAGAGGTDAQDWALMLMRMYTRWAEDHGMKVSVDELSEGRKRALRAARSKSRVATPTATCATKRAPTGWCASPLQCQRQAPDELRWRGGDAPDR